MSIKAGARASISPWFIRIKQITAMVKTKTGGTAPKSGQYQPSGTKKEITLTKGERVPPYGGKAKTFVLVDKTKHKN
jgi:hypothetical protein